MGLESDNNHLPSHSVVERHFYLMVHQCPQCGKGPFDLVSTEQTPDEQTDIWFTRCKTCGQGRRLEFDRKSLLVEEPENSTSSLPEVNPTDHPSRLLDVGQWLALFYSTLSAASEETDRKEAQRLGYEATLCLEEALKFYAPDSDLPPPEAVWTDISRQSLKDRPELFIRQKLLQMRDKLPSLQVMRKAISPDRKVNDIDGQPIAKKHWWNKWFKR